MDNNSSLVSAAVSLVDFFEENNFPYMLAGSIAGIAWGDLNIGSDIEAFISVDSFEIPGFITAIKTKFDMLSSDPVRIINKTQSLSLEERTSGIRINLFFAVLPFEKKAIERAVELNFSSYMIKICTAEDFILSKIAQDPDFDMSSIQGIINNCNLKLDMDYLDLKVKELAGILGSEDIYTRYNEYLNAGY